jgi:two-component system response regulator FlrC
MHLMFDEAQPASMQPAVVAEMPSVEQASPEMALGVEEEVDAVNLQHAVKSSEHQIIMAALQATESREEAARKLGISPRTLRYKLAQLRNRGMSLSFAE